jgi:DNA primase
MGFDVRLLVLPLEEDPDTWCLKLGAQAFKELVGNAPDWTSFIIDRALDGKDFRRTTDRMEALRDLAEFLVHLPSTPARRELFASLAHQLQIPLQELDRAIKSRLAPSIDRGPELAVAPAKVDVDDLLKPLLRLCWEAGIRTQLAECPPAWWESLTGAPLLQAVLDADGIEDHIPGEVLAQLRFIEAAWATKEDAESVAGTLFLKLEIAYVEREIQAVNRQMQEPAVKADPTALRRLEVRAAELLGRARHLNREKNNLTRRMF